MRLNTWAGFHALKSLLHVSECRSTSETREAILILCFEISTLIIKNDGYKPWMLGWQYKNILVTQLRQFVIKRQALKRCSGLY